MRQQITESEFRATWNRAFRLFSFEAIQKLGTTPGVAVFHLAVTDDGLQTTSCDDIETVDRFLSQWGYALERCHLTQKQRLFGQFAGFIHEDGAFLVWLNGAL